MYDQLTASRAGLPLHCASASLKAGFTGWVERDEYGFENLEDKPAEWILVVPNGAGEAG